MASRDNWECRACNGINGERDSTCVSCSQQRFSGGRYQHRNSSSSRRGGSGLTYDWDSLPGRPTSAGGSDDPRRRRCGTRYEDQAGRQWKCTECTYYNNHTSYKCKICNKSTRPGEPQVCPPGPARTDRNRYQKRTPSPPDRQIPPYDRKHDKHSAHDPGYDSRRTPDDGRRGIRSRTSGTPTRDSQNDSASGPRSRNGRKPVWEDCVNSKERRLVLLGKTGSGKSATGNSILSGDYFHSKVSGVSITRSCRRGVVQRNGKEIHVVDTPGIFDTDVDNDTTTKEIVKCIGVTAPGPHAFILVLRIGRFTKEEHESVEHFMKSFGKSVEKYMIVLFTRMDDLHDEHMSLDDHLSGIPPRLASILSRCGGRCVGFNNKGTSREMSRQVDELMEIVEDLFEANRGRYYTNDLYMEAENVIRIREAEIRSVAEEQKRRDIEEVEGENERYYKQLRKKYEKQQHDLEMKLKEAESGGGHSVRDRRLRTAEIDKDIKSIRAQIDQDQRAGRKVSQQLKNDLSDLEKKRNGIVKTDGTVRQMQGDIESLRHQLNDMKRKVSSAKREQDDNKEKRLKELEKKYAASENSTREVVRKEVENGKTNIGDQLLGTVIGLGKAIWKGLTKLF
ncbi:immune-associated nucleotide-binding protein 12-like [Pecten maximus]|uniref:immune-associated nucleotide-binding protein 12-like n=1 Tax=Pecten maximus TaxID=6579 RepID=UPI0014580E8B|nr:immune-associated nucleotide-binding protein 12-like [Pecten maximus]